MSFKTLNPVKKEKHPWAEYIPVNADKLILGTFPPKKENRNYDFYYPNKNNKFWRVLARIADFKLTDFEKTDDWKKLAVKERKLILNKLKLGITDIGSVVLRCNNSSLDSNLFPIKFSDIFSIVKKFPKIKTIILTSSSNGNSVLSWFRVYCEINSVELKIDKKNKLFPVETYIHLNETKLKVIIVNSTSGAAGKSEDFLVGQYKKAIF